LVAQTYSSWVALVFDDSPLQEAKTIVESFNDSRLIYKPNHQNLGASKNLNQCFDTKPYLNGNFAFVLEDDNWIYPDFIESNIKAFFKDRIVEQGFKKAFKGNWGSEAHTKRLGAVQDLNRLSWYTFISHLRKINLPLDSSAKVVGPRLLNSSQWGFICPIDTPDGGNIGLHKHLAISTYVTSGSSGTPIINIIGNTSTNKATRLDAVGLRIGTNADIHNANVRLFFQTTKFNFHHLEKQ
jgi:hypothetical protein